MPETPRYLLSKQEWSRASASLQWLRGAENQNQINGELTAVSSLKDNAEKNITFTACVVRIFVANIALPKSRIHLFSALIYRYYTWCFAFKRTQISVPAQSQRTK